MRDGKGTKARKEIAVSVLVVAGVLVTLYFYLAGVGRVGLNEISLAGVAVLLVGLAMYAVWDRINNLRKGLPAKDERSVNISHKAGYYAFIAAIWSAVLSQTLTNIVLGYEPDGGDVTAIVVLASGFVFILSYLYLERRGS